MLFNDCNIVFGIRIKIEIDKRILRGSGVEKIIAK